MIWIQVCILIVQIVIALVSYFTIHRHRAIYGLSTGVLRMPQGSQDDVHALVTTHIDSKLRSEKFTVIQLVERRDKNIEIILGQIKK